MMFQRPVYSATPLASAVCALISLSPATSAAQTRSSDQMQDNADDGFAWYTPTAADGTLPLPPPEARLEPVPLNALSPPSVLLSLSGTGRAYFAGLPEGTGSEFSLRIAGLDGALGAELGVLGPDNMFKLGMIFGFPFAVTLAQFSPQWQLQLALPMVRIGVGLYPVTVTSASPSGSISTRNRLMTLLAPELSPVGVRLTSCQRLFVEARLEGPGAWITLGNAVSTLTWGVGFSINVGVGLGGDPPAAVGAPAVQSARRSRRTCDNSFVL